MCLCLMRGRGIGHKLCPSPTLHTPHHTLISHKMCLLPPYLPPSVPVTNCAPYPVSLGINKLGLTLVTKCASSHHTYPPVYQSQIVLHIQSSYHYLTWDRGGGGGTPPPPFTTTRMVMIALLEPGITAHAC